MLSKKNKGTTYYDHISEAHKPIANRNETIVGRNGKKRVVRRHHLSFENQTQLLKNMVSVGKFISPYKPFTSYWGIVTALVSLGENQWHEPAQILKMMQKYMSDDESRDETGRTSWDRFKGRKARSPDGLDWIGRILQNCNVLQRLGGDDPYGLKLAQLGACIDIKAGEAGLPILRLRTGIPKGEDVNPINETKKRKCMKTVSSIPSQISFIEDTSLISSENIKEEQISEEAKEGV